MERCTLGIIVLSLSALLVFGNDPDVTEENLELGDTSNPDSPSDAFEKSVMDRLRPELRERMRKFFRQEPGQISDTDMRKLFESVFNREEQKEVEDIFTAEVQEQMEAIMGQMGGVGSTMDELTGKMGDFGGDHDHFQDDHSNEQEESYEEDFDFESEDLLNESAAWGNKKKFVLEPAESSRDEPAESSGEELQEKGNLSDEGEDTIINPTTVKDEF
uniref:Ribosome biogenesis protein ERB1 n=1 Tax=Lygus hesperus TaxID=30085 RepID=A0A0A9Z8Z8_LYGHE